MIQKQVERGCAYFTKSVRIPIAKIHQVIKTPSGDGCIIESDRGIQTVMDDYDAVINYLIENGWEGRHAEY